MRRTFLLPLFLISLLCIATVNTSSLEIVMETNHDLYYFEDIGLRDALEMTNGGEGIVVAIIDGGIYWNNSVVPYDLRWENSVELDGEIGVDDDENGQVDDFYGWDFIDDDNDPSIESIEEYRPSFGSVLSGILAGKTPEYLPEFTGVSPNVKIMDVRIVDNTGYASTPDIYNGIEYAIASRADVVIYNRVESNGFPNIANQMLLEAREKGTTVVVDSGWDFPSFMSTLDGVISVGGSGHNFSLSASSTVQAIETPNFPNYNPGLDILAPAEDIYYYEMYLDNITTISGSGISTPFVAGTIALMKGMDNSIPEEFINPILKYSATPVKNIPGYSNDLLENVTVGILNSSKSVESWINFRSLDFDNDGVRSGFEIENGYDPFDVNDYPIFISSTNGPNTVDTSLENHSETALFSLGASNVFSIVIMIMWVTIIFRRRSNNYFET